MRTIGAMAAAAVLFLGSASGGNSASGNVGVNSSSEGVNNSAGGGNAAVRNPAGGNTAINGANTPQTPGESASPHTGIVVAQPLKPGDIGYKGKQ